MPPGQVAGRPDRSTRSTTPKMDQNTNTQSSQFSQLVDRLSAEGVERVVAQPPVIGTHVRHEVRYLPFEYVNRTARLCLVGITPGPTQIELAYRTLAAVPAGLLATPAGREQALRRIKQAAAFGGSAMRPGLVRLLRAYPFAQILGVEDNVAGCLAQRHVATARVLARGRID